MYTLFMCNIGFLGAKAIQQQPQKAHLKQVLYINVQIITITIFSLNI